MTTSAESRKEEFQKYLEKNGVIDALTKVLVGLYEAPDKPANAIDFVKEYLGGPVGGEIEKLKKEVDDKQKLLDEKDKQIEQLKKEVATLKGESS